MCSFFVLKFPIITCNINAHLALKGLENFLCDSIRQILLVNIFPETTQIENLLHEFFPPRLLTTQYDWLTKITWDIAHTILRVGEKTLGKVLGLHRMLLKNPSQKRTEKCENFNLRYQIKLCMYVCLFAWIVVSLNCVLAV